MREPSMREPRCAGTQGCAYGPHPGCVRVAPRAQEPTRSGPPAGSTQAIPGAAVTALRPRTGCPQRPAEQAALTPGRAEAAPRGTGHEPCRRQVGTGTGDGAWTTSFAEPQCPPDPAPGLGGQSRWRRSRGAEDRHLAAPPAAARRHQGLDSRGASRVHQAPAPGHRPVSLWRLFDLDPWPPGLGKP